MSPEHIALKARLARVKTTDGGDVVEDLTVEWHQQQPKLIRGVVLEPGTGPSGTRRSSCTWLPNGRHRLYPKLNLTIPEM